MKKYNFKNKKVLLMGLGILGGGLNLANWLLKQGAVLTITDLKTRAQLKKSLDQLPKNKKIKLVLGRHQPKDFLENQIIVCNQDILPNNSYLKLAEGADRQIEDELTLFFKFSPTKNIIAVTGTRGKTTTNLWTAQLLRSKFKNTLALGNSPENSLIANLKRIKPNQPVCLELPSCLLEQSRRVKFRPKIAIITNLFQDHLNRYNGQIKNYVSIKANIFKFQRKSDYLILNHNNLWTKFFLKLKPRSKVLFFSTKQLPVKMNGIFVKDKYKIYFRENKKEKFIFDAKNFVYKWGEHNLENLLPAIVCAFKYKVSIKNIIKSIKNLPGVRFRQELIYKDRNLEIYNDTCATSPEAVLAALKRFGQKKSNLILITGGTDRNLNYKNWAREIKKYLNQKQIIFLAGSATKKMIQELNWKKISPLDNLEKCVKLALQRVKQNTGEKIILFSPGAKSFEKFNNEFDRGEKFNQLIKNI